MDRGETRKVILVTEMDYPMEDIEKQINVNLENIMIIKRYGPLKLQPFGDLMRDILIAVYKENVEEIFVIGTKNDRKEMDYIYKKIIEKKGVEKNIQTLDYLFKHNIPYFPDEKVSEWLEGGKSFSDDLQNSIQTIGHHPLMPSNVKVSAFCIEKKNDRLTEKKVF